MKIRLVREGSVQILSISGPVVGQNIEVLRAGIRKLLNGGHNRIVLEFLSPDELNSAALEGINQLVQMAKKLLGEIAIIYPKSPKPNELVVECHLNRESALKHFLSNGRVVSELSAKITSQENAIEELRKQLRGSETGNYQKEIAALKEENKVLKLRIEEFVQVFRNPQSSQAYAAKVASLQEEMVRLRGIIQSFRVPESDEAYAAKVAFLEEEIARLKDR